MKALPDFLPRCDRRTLLLAVALVLLLLNAGRYGWQAYADWQTDFADRLTLLRKYQKVAATIDSLKGEVSSLTSRRQQAASYLFSGPPEEAASAMQLMLQEEVVKAGLEPEFIQPAPVAAPAGEAPKGRGPAAIAIKLRLGGNLNSFAQFIQAIYRSPKLFLVESLTLKPVNKENLKIFMEVKGYCTPSAAPLPAAR